jgi:hypothetical protein
MTNFLNIINDLSLILLSKLDKLNKQSLSTSYDDFIAKQDFSKLSVLEAGNEDEYEQWCFKNKKANGNRCKRLKPFQIHPNNIPLQEYKQHIESGSVSKHQDLITQTLHKLLYEEEKRLGKSFKLTSKVAQDEVFTESILTYLISEQNPIIVNEIKKIMQNGGNDFMKILVFNNNNITEYYRDLLDSFNVYINNVIKRLDEIPEIEQKTPEWFELRANMISASICGYMDGYVCGAGISKEHEKIKEKSGITSKKNFSMGTGPLKHGILFEDVTGELYDALNGLISKEYGILPDYRHPQIGASPDGIIIGFKDTSQCEERNILQECKFGRMREIKNPTSRSITNGKIPNYYYYQMLQQMYVCDLPYCDFIQTSITYPETNMDIDDSRIINFFTDTFEVKNLENLKTFQDLSKYFPDYLVKKIDWWNGLVKLNQMDNVLVSNIENLEYYLINLLKNNWDVFCSIPICNLNKKGKVKGIFWYYTKGSKENLEYKYCWTPLDKPIDYTSIGHITENKLQQWVNDGYTLSDKYYFTVDVYDEKEIEYNQGLYDNALSRLLKTWDFIMELRNIPDVSKRLEVFNNKYILHNNTTKSKIYKDMKSSLDDTIKPSQTPVITNNSNSNMEIDPTNTLSELILANGITSKKSTIKKKKKVKNKSGTNTDILSPLSNNNDNTNDSDNDSGNNSNNDKKRKLLNELSTPPQKCKVDIVNANSDDDDDDIFDLN